MPMITGETTIIETVQKRRDVRIVAIPVVALDTTPEPSPPHVFNGDRDHGEIFPALMA
jgi:hypothetical protein